MIEIKKKHYIGEGLERKCYHHPDNSNLCIKIGKPEIEEERLYKEIKYYNKIKNKDVSKFDYLFYSKYYGRVETNKGNGFVYELVKDETTLRVSLTLRHYLEMVNSPIPDKIIVEELKRLKQQMITHRIFVGDLRARNICCKILKDGSVRLIIIDGMGHRDFFPFADWFHYYAKKKVERRFVNASLNGYLLNDNLIKKLCNLE